MHICKLELKKTNIISYKDLLLYVWNG